MGILIYMSPQRWYISGRPFSKVGDRGFEPRLGQTNDYKIVIYDSSGTHITLRNKRKAVLSRLHDNVTEWNERYASELIIISYQYKHQTKRVGQVQSGLHYHLI